MNHSLKDSLCNCFNILLCSFYFLNVPLPSHNYQVYKAHLKMFPWLPHLPVCVVVLLKYSNQLDLSLKCNWRLLVLEPDSVPNPTHITTYIYPVIKGRSSKVILILLFIWLVGAPVHILQQIQNCFLWIWLLPIPATTGMHPSTLPLSTVHLCGYLCMYLGWSYSKI